MKRVAILTTFTQYLESYSLCQIARMQLRMFAKNGYDIRFIYRGGGGWEALSKDIKQIPDFIAENNGDVLPAEKRYGKSFAEMITESAAAIEEHIKDMDVVITHDLIYQPSNRIQDAAAAIVAEKYPNILWLHWVHSATGPAQLGKKDIRFYKNAFICYPNSWDVPRVARNFNYEESQIRVIPHPLDFEEFFDLHPLTVKLIDEKSILSADVLACYPLRLDRGKQPEMCIHIFDGIKKHFKRSIRLIIVDFQSTGGDKVTYREELKQLALNYGWTSDELIFMSEFDKECHLQTPKKVVRDLFLLSNVYIHPSKSETYSLTAQEARICKNLLVLNFDFPPMRSIYKEDALYKKFSSCVNVHECCDGETNVKYNPGVREYMREVAGNILFYLDQQQCLAGATETRQNKNMQAIFKRHIEPLIHGFGIARGRE